MIISQTSIRHACIVRLRSAPYRACWWTTWRVPITCQMVVTGFTPLAAPRVDVPLSLQSRNVLSLQVMDAWEKPPFPLSRLCGTVLAVKGSHSPRNRRAPLTAPRCSEGKPEIRKGGMRKPAIVGHFYFAATHPSLHFPHFKKPGDRNLQEIWSARVTLHSCQNCSEAKLPHQPAP